MSNSYAWVTGNFYMRSGAFLFALLCAAVVSTYRKLCMDGEKICRIAPMCQTRHFVWRKKRILICVIRPDRKIKQTKFPAAATVVAQKVFIDTYESIQCSIWAYIANAQMTCLQWRNDKSTIPAIGSEYSNWTIEEWMEDAWSKESRFLIHHIDERV